MTIEDGFPGQRLFVLPRPTVRAALQRPGTAHLVVTDCGYFPEARAHGMTRTSGIDQAIVIACTKGQGWCVIEGVQHTVHAGQVMIIQPGVPHSYGADPDDPWTLWWLHIAGRDLLEFLRAAGMTPAAPVRGVSDIYRVVALVEEVVHWMGEDSTWENLVAASGAAWHLMALLSANRQLSGNGASTVEGARDYLRNHLEERVSVNDLAAMASLSTSHFAVLFREHVGMAVLQYQTQLRMARARELLDTTDKDVADIAEEVGYQDSFYFSRLFRKVHGVPPRTYRAQHKG
ncbi:AraC family transcriptional regulator [Agromyces albus]|uniref:AraC family transcriptional regulator n=1 Tax=Agromyces albus TaxID=205332 RepID=A0A4Q2KYE3_9MICO|nr:AraC family transcriptional regulator [Agromyces albus]RXZ68631.1 AraC family transcriptional regulator [Agromyces albus]